MWRKIENPKWRISKREKTLKNSQMKIMKEFHNNKHEKQWWYGKNKTIKQFEFIFKHLFLNFAQNEKGKRREKRCEKNILFTFE